MWVEKGPFLPLFVTMLLSLSPVVTYLDFISIDLGDKGFITQK